MEILDMLCENKHMSVLTNLKSNNKFMYNNQVQNLKKQEELNLLKSLSNRIAKIRLPFKKKSSTKIPILQKTQSDDNMSSSLQLKNSCRRVDESEISLSSKISYTNIPSLKPSKNASIRSIIPQEEDIEVVQLFPLEKSSNSKIPILIRKDSKIPILVKPNYSLKRSSDISRKSSNGCFKSRIPIPVNKSKSSPIIKNKACLKFSPNILKKRSYSLDSFITKNHKLSIYNSRVVCINSEMKMNLVSPPKSSSAAVNLSPKRRLSPGSIPVSVHALESPANPEIPAKKRYPVLSPGTSGCSTRKIDFTPDTKKSRR